MDAALFTSSDSFGVACLARDSSGLMVEALTRNFSGTIDPALAEAIVVREALSWIKARGWLNVIIETDSIVQALRSNIHLPSYFGSIIQICKSIWKTLPSVSILFVKRSANKVVHSLVSVSYSYDDQTVLGELIDPITCNIVLSES